MAKKEHALTIKGQDADGKPVALSFPTALIGPLVQQLFAQLIEYVKSPEGQAQIFALIASLFGKKEGVR